MRVIARRERPHPGAQLRLTDVDGWRVTLFATSTKAGGKGTQLADLELRHRLRARCEDRIRVVKDLGLENLPSADPIINTVWTWGALIAGNLATMLQALTGIDDPLRGGPDEHGPSGCACT